MFAKNSKAYSVYLLFRFVSSLAVSMSTVLSIVYHLEVVQLDAFQLVLVGTVLFTFLLLSALTQARSSTRKLLFSVQWRSFPNRLSEC